MKKLLALIALTFPLTAFAGGFWISESATKPVAQQLTAAQIKAFLPDKRGPFQFPAPYDTTGIRVTLPSDCPKALNCIYYTGYSYYATMNNSAGLPYMWIMAVPQAKYQTYYGPGPTLYKLDKATDAVTKVGPIFTDNNKFNTGETMYFSHSLPNAIYYVNLGKTSLNRINVVTHKETEIFDVTKYNASDHVIACTSSFDDQTHACQLETATWAKIGCIVYHSNTGKFQAFTFKAGIHSCAMSPDGSYLYTSVTSTPPETVITMLATGKQITIAAKDGGSGHHALGYGWALINNHYVPKYGAIWAWDIATLPAPGKPIFDVPYSSACIKTDCATIAAHPSWLNAVPVSTTPLAKQYVCDSTASGMAVPLGNVVFCYHLDSSVAPTQKKALVIAPSMTMATANGGCAGPNGVYGNEPKGNIDPTGHYFMWSANLDSNNNCQVFLVKIPAALAGGAPTQPAPVSTAPTQPAPTPATVPVLAPGVVTVPHALNSCLFTKYQDAYGHVHFRIDCRTDRRSHS